MIKLGYLFAVVVGLSACASPNVQQIADEWCECKTIEVHQSSLKGEQCIQEWDKKYGKLTFNEQEEMKFNEIISKCINE